MLETKRVECYYWSGAGSFDRIGVGKVLFIVLSYTLKIDTTTFNRPAPTPAKPKRDSSKSKKKGKASTSKTKSKDEDAIAAFKSKLKKGQKDVKPKDRLSPSAKAKLIDLTEDDSEADKTTTKLLGKLSMAESAVGDGGRVWR